MYGSDSATDESERTAFRKAEKKYKLYYDQNTKSSKKKKQPRPVDLSEVIDFKSIKESLDQRGELPTGISVLQHDFDRPVFCLEKRPGRFNFLDGIVMLCLNNVELKLVVVFSSAGFYFIPGALSTEEQCHWIRESLTNFPQPHNRTNHNAVYGPIHDLFTAAKEKMVLAEENLQAGSGHEDDSLASDMNAPKWKFCEEDSLPSKRNKSKSTPASVLLRKLRWSTLGLQFDWSKRAYNISLPHNKIPHALCRLARKVAAPEMPFGEELQLEAAIVNYFGPGDMLGGHLDDMEADWSRPIVSMSLGCKAVFLLGGKSREDPPLAMFLRSGDIVLMAGEARECFHGVPRIFTDEESAEVTPLELQFSHEDDLCFLDYIKTSRININIRQVF
ncbi:hypothetical protein RJ639_029206 [Escallonia herrerae]|uniref:Fe2OG dioxygenase domain-containing protein n=1 Tax=Escallonia herrerae TaxID=1293975 RepID=A0AA89BLB1_9ASTE|nr:hypothetical protein RJ639_029206 [Escallonia herrerae]